MGGIQRTGARREGFAIGAGRLPGLDAYVEDLESVENNRWLRLLLG